MASSTEPNAGLAELVKCLHGVVKVIRTLSADHPAIPDKQEKLPKSISAVAAQLRGSDSLQ